MTNYGTRTPEQTYYRRTGNGLARKTNKNTRPTTRFVPTPIEDLAIDSGVPYMVNKNEITARWVHYIPLVKEMGVGDSIEVFSFAEAASVKVAIFKHFGPSVTTGVRKIEYARSKRTGDTTFRVWRMK